MISSQARKRRVRKTAVAAITAAAFLATGTAVASAATSSTSPLVVSFTADRANPQTLSAKAVKGNIYVFLNRANVQQVQFFLDVQSKNNVPLRTEHFSPYDLAGTAADGSAQPFETTKLSDGRHRVLAVVKGTNSHTRSYRATFTVANKVYKTLPAPVPTTARSTTTTAAKVTTTTVKSSSVPSSSATNSRPAAIPSTGGPGIPAPTGKAWNLAFSEEFNGSDYDHSKLTPCFDWNTGDCTSSFNQGRETYEPSQVRVSNGTAKLVAEPLSTPVSSSACQGGKCTYKSGLLSTARPNASNGSNYLYKFTYGYVESRMKIPNKQGFFTAFWMLPADGSYNYQTEIDILENLGYDPKTMYMTYHHDGRSQSFTPNAGTGNNGACPVKDYSSDFHNIGVDWEPDHIAWYIDGQKCGQFTDASKIEKGPMQIIMDLMVDNNWQRSWNKGLLDATLTGQLEVDYLRVYQAH